jgi:preprotein translocase subunit SecE
VARDRQRAKQRKARRAQQRGAVRPSQPRRTDVPGELQHASGEVDEFEAALVRGADGQPVEDEPDVREEVDRAEDELRDEDDVRAEEDVRGEDDDRSVLVGRSADDDLDDEPSALVSRPEDEDDFDDERSAVAEVEPEDEDFDDATLEREAVRSAPAVRREAAPGAPTRKGAGRFAGFLRASWAELQRVQWPDRRQVAQATGVVIGFVIVAGLYLGVADWVAKQIVNAII